MLNANSFRQLFLMGLSEVNNPLFKKIYKLPVEYPQPLQVTMGITSCTQVSV